MRVPIQRSLVRWDQLDDPSDPAAIRQVFALLDRGPLLKTRTRARGRGRDKRIVRAPS